jgi:hypothetical protein
MRAVFLDELIFIVNGAVFQLSSQRSSDYKLSNYMLSRFLVLCYAMLYFIRFPCENDARFVFSPFCFVGSHVLFMSFLFIYVYCCILSNDNKRHGQWRTETLKRKTFNKTITNRLTKEQSIKPLLTISIHDQSIGKTPKIIKH